MQGSTVDPAQHPRAVVPAHESLVEVTPDVIDAIRRMPFMDIDELGDWIIDHYDRDAFRLETRDRYLVDSDEADYQSYLAGAAGPDREAKAGWLDFLADAAEQGRRWRYLHILDSRDMTDYLRFELEWCYTDNETAGADIRVLDLAEVEVPEYLRDLDDFYLVDGHAAVLSYDSSGRYLYALPVDDPTRLIVARDRLWDAAEDFSDWWARHPEHHRGRRGAA